MSRPAPQSRDFYHRHPYYEVPEMLQKGGLFDNENDGTEHFSVILGSDLVLSAQTPVGKDYVEVWAFDSDGNGLEVMACFRTPADALAALPVVSQMSRELYPNHLLMDRAARETA